MKVCCISNGHFIRKILFPLNVLFHCSIYISQLFMECSHNVKNSRQSQMEYKIKQLLFDLSRKLCILDQLCNKSTGWSGLQIIIFRKSTQLQRERDRVKFQGGSSSKLKVLVWGGEKTECLRK